VTSGQLKAGLATSAELPDGIKVNLNPVDPSEFKQSKSSGPFTKASCISLQGWQNFGVYGTQPILSGGEALFRKISGDPSAIGGGWNAGESIAVYRGSGAQQVMSALVRLAARCTSAQVISGYGTTSSFREHVVKLAGIGDQAFNIEVHITFWNTNSGPTTTSAMVIAENWILIRSGRCLLAVYEFPTPSSIPGGYLEATARAALRIYESGT
jgi:hypothetical protein